MAQSLSRLWTHLIFSTKERFPFLSDWQIRRDMKAYLATVLRSYDCETIVVNGTANHVHALFALSRKYSMSTVVKELKRTSSGWVKEVSPALSKFHWQNGDGAFSVINRTLVTFAITSKTRSTTIDEGPLKMSTESF